MGDIMRPVPFGELLNRIFSSIKRASQFLGFHRSNFIARIMQRTYPYGVRTVKHL